MRHFEVKNKPYGENNGWRKVAIAHCSKCPKEHQVAVSASGGIMPDEPIMKKFLADGWAMGRDEKHDVCPDCVKSPHFEKPGTPAIKLVKPDHIKIATGHVVDAPKEMDRDNRRVIFVKVEEVYADEKTGYIEGWSDHRVATDLGVPRVWVEEVRSKMFGPIATNPETSAFLVEVEEALAECKDVYEEISKIKRLIDKFTQDHGPTIARFIKLAECMESLEKKANEIRKRGM